jgi:hypothetical protein
MHNCTENGKSKDLANNDNNFMLKLKNTRLFVQSSCSQKEVDTLKDKINTSL